jgi:hypothetical protein
MARPATRCHFANTLSWFSMTTGTVSKVDVGTAPRGQHAGKSSPIISTARSRSRSLIWRRAFHRPASRLRQRSRESRQVIGALSLATPGARRTISRFSTVLYGRQVLSRPGTKTPRLRRVRPHNTDVPSSCTSARASIFVDSSKFSCAFSRYGACAACGGSRWRWHLPEHTATSLLVTPSTHWFR